MNDPVAPARRRLTWADLPDRLRAGIEHRFGPVLGARSHEGGYSPGMASTLTTADGRVFVKAVSVSFHSHSATAYRKEAWINGLLPTAVPAPRMRWSFDDGDWIALAFDAADAPITVPWRPGDLADALTMLTELAAIDAPPQLDPASARLGGMPSWHTIAGEATELTGWDPWVAANLDLLSQVSAGWPDRADGPALAQFDARADNMVRCGDRVLLADWPHALAATPWLDLVCFLPSAALEGAGDPERLWVSTPVGQAADQAAATAVLAGITGYFVHSSLQPAPPGVPHLRRYQRAQGEVALAWLRQRLAGSTIYH